MQIALWQAVALVSIVVFITLLAWLVWRAARPMLDELAGYEQEPYK